MLTITDIKLILEKDKVTYLGTVLVQYLNFKPPHFEKVTKSIMRQR